MDDERQTAETSAEESAQVGYAEPDFDEEQEEVSDAEFSDSDGEETEENQFDSEEEEVETQNSQYDEEENQSVRREKSGKNAEQARLRRERERKDAYRRGVMDAVGGINPYTGESIEDDADIDEYILMREIEEDGGDPISDYHRYAKAKRKEQSGTHSASVNGDADKRAWFDEDKRNFLEKNPDVDINKLIKDKNFLLFARGKVGVSPLSEIYDDYIALTVAFEQKAERKAQNEIAKSKASPGSLSFGGNAAVGYEAMSDADFDRKLKAVLSGKEKI